MKKSNIILLLTLLFGTYQVMIPFFYPDLIINPNTSPIGLTMVILIYMGLFTLAIYFKIEESDLSTKEISLIAVYSAFTAVARIPFIALPSVQPCSYLIFCAGYAFGPMIGFIIGANTALLSNFILGQGPWTAYQMFGWGLMGIIGGIVNPKRNAKPNKYLNATVGFIFGFLYGWILNLWFWMLFVSPLTFESWILTNLASFYFDLSHAVANAIFLYYFGDRTINTLYRYRQRFLIQFIEIQDYSVLIKSQNDK